MGLVAHAPFLGRDLARLALRFWAERMGRAGGGFIGLVAYLFWPGAWLGLLCAFGANALAWSAAGSMGGVAGFAKDIFPLPGNKKTARRKAMARRAVFSAQTPAFSPLDLLFSRLPPAFCKKQKQTPAQKRGGL